MKPSEEIIKKLISTALDARKNSYSPYSKFSVGAAVLTDDDKIISGTNIENISFGLACCAERVALFKAVSEGHKKFKALAVVTDDGSTPCGACRQVILELCGDIPIIIATPDYKYEVINLSTLLPRPFSTHVDS